MIKPNFGGFVDTMEDVVDQNLTILGWPRSYNFINYLLQSSPYRESNDEILIITDQKLEYTKIKSDAVSSKSNITFAANSSGHPLIEFVFS